MFNKKATQQESSHALRMSKFKQERKNILSAKSGFYLQEAYKALRTNVNFALADQEECKVLMVTSAMQAEGKSITALNLAIALGQTDKRVLLVDCDLRRPKMARLLNINAAVGLSSLLVDISMLNTAVVPSKEHGIDLILAGAIPPNPAELLASAKMQKLLSVMREKYDYVILDSPPVDLVVDAVAMSSMCDGVLFVVRAGQSERGAVIHGMEQLKYAGANVIGFVFNGVTSETASGYGKYRYRKYARYGHYSKYRRYGYRYGYSGYGYGYKQHSMPADPAFDPQTTDRKF